MNDRRIALLDAGIGVLGEQGVRAVTHRAVDAAAGLPAGSTSNHFRTRDALFDALVVRISERERRNWEELARRAAPTTATELAATLSMFAIEATSDHRSLTLARYAILVESGSRPALRDQLLRTSPVNSWGELWLRAIGFPDVTLAANLIMNYWTGLVLHQLAIPDPLFDPGAKLAELVQALLATSHLPSPLEKSPSLTR